MKYIHDDYGYQALFDEKTGLLLRNEKKGKRLFWKQSGPELLDVSITNYCEKGCSFCYRGSNMVGKSMDLDLYIRVLDEAKKAGVTQIALGGGNPNQHPKFIEILKVTRGYGIVPSFTTNGQGMTDEIYAASRQYAGAIAVSWYESSFEAVNVIDKCNEYNIPINIHYILDANNIKQAREFLQNSILNKINALIFLNYKPVRTGKRDVLKHNQDVERFLECAINTQICKIGFDSCMISHLVKLKNSINIDSIDFCEAGRFSAFISELGMMYPCSFMCGVGLKGESLECRSLVDIWQNSIEFKEIREKLDNCSEMCAKCASFEICHGGCPCFDINCEAIRRFEYDYQK